MLKGLIKLVEKLSHKPDRHREVLSEQKALVLMVWPDLPWTSGCLACEPSTEHLEVVDLRSRLSRNNKNDTMSELLGENWREVVKRIARGAPSLNCSDTTSGPNSSAIADGLITSPNTVILVPHHPSVLKNLARASVFFHYVVWEDSLLALRVPSRTMRDMVNFQCDWVRGTGAAAARWDKPDVDGKAEWEVWRSVFETEKGKRGIEWEKEAAGDPGSS